LTTPATSTGRDGHLAYRSTHAEPTAGRKTKRWQSPKGASIAKKSKPMPCGVWTSRDPRDRIVLCRAGRSACVVRLPVCCPRDAQDGDKPSPSRGRSGTFTEGCDAGSGSIEWRVRRFLQVVRTDALPKTFYDQFQQWPPQLQSLRAASSLTFCRTASGRPRGSRARRRMRFAYPCCRDRNAYRRLPDAGHRRALGSENTPPDDPEQAAFLDAVRKPGESYASGPLVAV